MKGDNNTKHDNCPTEVKVILEKDQLAVMKITLSKEVEQISQLCAR